MTVVTLMETYHEFGWALRRIMGSKNVRAKSQEDFAAKMSRGGYPVGQQVISDYMRNVSKTDEETGEEIVRPRVLPSMEFVAALVTNPEFKLDSSQREDAINSWLDILPESRRVAVLGLCSSLRDAEVSSDAWREMLAYEEERSSEEDQESNGRQAGGAAS